MKPAPRAILFVCTGNTCRSPMAEALLRTMLAKTEGTPAVRVWSRGVGALTGAPISRGALAALQAIGIDATAHRAQALSAQDVAQADLILVMEDAHRAIIAATFPEAVQKTAKLLAYAGEGDADVSDPIGSDFEHYVETRRRLEGALLAVLSKLKTVSA